MLPVTVDSIVILKKQKTRSVLRTQNQQRCTSLTYTYTKIGWKKYISAAIYSWRRLILWPSWIAQLVTIIISHHQNISHAQSIHYAQQWKMLKPITFEGFSPIFGCMGTVLNNIQFRSISGSFFKQIHKMFKHFISSNTKSPEWIVLD